MQYRLKDSINDYIGQLEKANDDFEAALSIIDSVVNELKTDNWKGKNKDAILPIMSAFKEYHQKTLNISKDNVQVMKDLSDNAQNFISSGKIPTMWK